VGPAEGNVGLLKWEGEAFGCTYGPKHGGGAKGLTRIHFEKGFENQSNMLIATEWDRHEALEFD
jgi:hypothetical protein